MLPQLAYSKVSGNYDHNSILRRLSCVYYGPNKVSEAEGRLVSLKQDTDPLAVFLARFERILYGAHGHDWPDVAKIAAFLECLIPTSEPTSQASLSRYIDTTGRSANYTKKAIM
ncbi:hypothetical protein N7481_010865 [Penicillium waksmanii]|uniref:uncharacterized protein n=1 Tax=Penicillium waksmanii TaxID=69791 RepID=UPI002546A9E7|nr:uncharacterized protein N7481_010865 [Penicillium waksmanii]KAJ5973655.1 hypothetical protein N7481_010865 [Penicillium waksmanii]